MAQYRANLPQLSNDLLITDGGLETTLIFREGLDLPDFAAFDLLKHDAGYRAIQAYFRTYAIMARNYQVGLILESATWRANPDWGTKLGYSSAASGERLAPFGSLNSVSESNAKPKSSFWSVHTNN